ncbi:hypothetical protein ACJIZ3_013876 [Penstemon smallii]|uniref:Oberon PHD finger domain-containing protein n=1 Tax=Penstemon smallii TaxID=265156 RepID=A0ABD3RIB0_9LAMI
MQDIMTRELQESMDIDSAGRSIESPNGLKGNGFHLYPVSAGASGEGLPYAPEDWPNLGDKWGWKAGRRITNSGYYTDRYIYPPIRLCQDGKASSFKSRLSLEQYIRAKFPDADVYAFFASFCWKIPSESCEDNDKEKFKSLVGISEHSGSGNDLRCKAGNKVCSSLGAGEMSDSAVMFCDICCNEPGFCRDCCCILCCRTITEAFGGYDYITCEANIEGCVCGHNCHIDCALRAYMAGTVGGSIGLDAEYYCRRCDSRTDLVSHVEKLVKNCESIDSRDDIEKVLKVCIRVLRGSKKTNAYHLLHQIELAMEKLKDGAFVGDIWKKEDASPVTSDNEMVELSPIANGASKSTDVKESRDSETGSPPTSSSKFHHRVESLKLEDKIDQVLQALRKSQEIEYRLAEEKLSAQKSHIKNLYQQLDKEKSELSGHTSQKDQDELFDVILNCVDQIKQEVSKFKDMEEVANGFGRVPKHILQEQFGLDI